MDLPALPYDFNHAFIDGVAIGPRHEITLTILLIAWEGSITTHSVRVRFGGIVNFEEAMTFFATPAHNHTDIARLRYDVNHTSKPNSLFFELIYERIDARIMLHCRNISFVANP
jgi:hypothetical protein